LVIAIPAVALLVTIGLEQSVHLAWRLAGSAGSKSLGDTDVVVSRSKAARWENVVLLLLLLVMAVGNVRYYFVEFTPQRRYGSENGETATMIGSYLRELEGDVRVHFFGAPRIYWRFGTMSFLAPEILGRDVVEPLAAPPDLVDSGQRAVFIFLPERAGELAWVEQAFPDGSFSEYRDGTGRKRFVVYEVQP
jgi:hypothetical protein